MVNKIDSSLYLSNKITQRNTGQQTLGKDDFLKILMTQLQHQDPLNPMEDKEFISQMASFSSLEQMTNMSKMLEKFISSQGSDSIFRFSELIGKKIEWSDVSYVEAKDGIREVMTTGQGIVKSVSQRGNETLVELDNGDVISSKVISKISVPDK
ncbi:flagellar hook assembly protein FlgD [Bacillus timonensis]|nr:flagellar hook assembly protein FlgD [Bacillus timonensis]